MVSAKKAEEEQGCREKPGVRPEEWSSQMRTEESLARQLGDWQNRS